MKVFLRSELDAIARRQNAAHYVCKLVYGIELPRPRPLRKLCLRWTSSAPRTSFFRSTRT